MNSRPLSKPDVVYLWVDGSDPHWRQQRLLQAKVHEKSLGWRYANVEGRFRDNDELRYSLRSLTPFLDQIGRIYLVTDNQRPSWLANHPQMHLISHYDLRGEGSPTYSSIALEASLHLIPGLGERFLYLNDDVFLGPAFTVDEFFSGDHKQFVHFEREADAGAAGEPHRTAADVSSLLLKGALPGYVHHNAPFAHAPRAVYTSVVQMLEHKFPAAFEIARQEVFRRPHTPSILADLYPRWMLATGNADMARPPHQLISSGDPLIHEKLTQWKQQWQDLVFFCVNDTLDDAPDNHPSLGLIRSALEDAYPAPSPFEK